MITKEKDVYDEEQFKKFELLRKDYKLPKDGTVHKMKISPRCAKRMKELVPSFQRNLIKSQIKNLGIAISRGEYVPTGDSIMFDTCGNCINGQQRLSACIEQEKPIVCNVSTGYDPIKTYKAVDAYWRKKGFNAMLKYAGYQNCNKLSAALTWVYRYQKGLLSYESKNFETTQIGFDVLIKNPEIEKSLPYGSKMGKDIASCSIVASCHYLCAMIDRKQANECFDAMALGSSNGFALQINNPIFQCRRALQDNYIKEKTTAYSKMRLAFKLAMLIKMWNAWRLHKRLRSAGTLYWRKKDINEPFPKPI